jgi:DNA invertase Pin-like site-specific DNA recombinase
MRVFGYIFLARDQQHLIPESQQREALQEYSRGLGRPLDEFVIEENGVLKRSFKDRPTGNRLLQNCLPGDVILVMRIGWVFNSVGDGLRTLRLLKSASIALHCLDVGGNISFAEKRRLLVSEGPAAIVEKVLAALTFSEDSRHGQAIRTAKKHGKEQGKYLGGPVPFGWEVSRQGRLEPHEGQQLIINAIFALRKDRWSYREISQKLQEEYKVRLSHEGVRRIFKSDNRRAKQTSTVA